ncbi:uncharacterized protein [Spinacia oleracea]|uniref:Shugoshin C-terminal domain-containing protein n=1 Tax=Spinacia oleracea TaxID=3562 RepID=A0ABM3QLN7_SPIOL|nr:uncharacterized protein LOC110794268 [Spinacia oleracea]
MSVIENHVNQLNWRVGNLEYALKEVKDLIIKSMKTGDGNRGCSPSSPFFINDDSLKGNRGCSPDSPFSINDNSLKGNRGHSPFLTPVGNSVKRKLIIDQDESGVVPDDDDDGPTINIRDIRFTASQFPDGMDTLMEFPILDVVNKKKKDPVTSSVEKKTTEKAPTKKSPDNTGGITYDANQPERKITKRRGTRLCNKDKQLEEETNVGSEQSGENEVIMERVPPEKPNRGRPPKSPAVMKEGLPLEKPKRGRPPKSPGVINPREEVYPCFIFTVRDANEPSRARVWLSSTRTRKLIVKLDSTRKLASLKFSNSTRTRKLNPSSNSTRNRLKISSKTQSRAQKLNSSSNSA